MNAPPLLKEKLPRLPRPAVANHRVPTLDPTHGAPGSPPPHPPFSPVSPPPHPIGHLEGHLAGRRPVTWWWVSPISPVSPSSPPTPPGPHSRVATRRLLLVRGGRLPALILAPGTPLLTPSPRVPFLLTPLVTPHLTPTRLHVDNLKTQAKCRCVLAAFEATVLAAFQQRSSGGDTALARSTLERFARSPVERNRHTVPWRSRAGEMAPSALAKASAGLGGCGCGGARAGRRRAWAWTWARRRCRAPPLHTPPGSPTRG